MIPTPPFANPLQPLIDVAESIILYFHNDLALSWGVSIIALTFVTRLVILPLSLKQIRSMRALQALQPQMKEIQAKYKDDKQRMQQEMMRFYQENNVNPLSSCLPLILQLPVFMSLFYLLRGDSFRMDVNDSPDGPGFVFINSIVEPATGGTLAILIVLYVATQLGAGLVMMTTPDRTQRLIMFGLPIVFVPIIIGFPAGLVVYWITTNVWTLGQQAVVKRLIPPPDLATAEGAAAIASTKAPPPPPRKKKKKRGGKRR